ncbi:hypothetical protein G7077_11250 [Sphingomonas piscis]|uniref:Uncharacterized protein n=1 Tax=Sphingomonas piscis TaxID=2714943 RepID=A0A6G7YRN4_9SPHN|nr:hypothetical protein [Sphingomonas piscis]QIK79392.1 hypothetical protein G7077_11250 [Sphingomonas piscis]
MTDDSNTPDPSAGEWHPVPTIFVDGVLGSSTLGGVHRIILGEFVFNTVPGATNATAKPVINLNISDAALPFLIEYLQNLPRQAQNAG